MRLQNGCLNNEQCNDMRSFGEWLLQLGEGLIESTKHDVETEASWIKIPDEFLIYTDDLKIKAIFEYIYPDFITNYFNMEYLKQRAILTPANDLATTTTTT